MTAEYQEQLRRVILERALPAEAVQSLGAEAWRWEAYRRLVRNRLYETLDHAFERVRASLGEPRYRDLVDSFLATEGPRSPYLRDLAAELLAWLEGRVAVGGLEVPAYALDLARLEWAELDVAYAPDPPHAGRSVVELAMDRPAVLCPSWRVLHLDHPVHRFVAGVPPPAAEPTVLCLYRDVTTHDVHTLEVTPIVGELLGEIGEADRPLAQLIAEIARRSGVIVDGAWLTAWSAVLADFTERGLILGSSPLVTA